MAARDHAIVIGVRTYPHLSSLQGPCHDAVAFRDWLVDPRRGAVPEANVNLLITDQYRDPDRTRHPMTDEMHDLFRTYVRSGLEVVDTGPSVGRRLYIYLAGHGFSEAGNMTEAALYAADAEPSFAPHVAATAYANWFRYNAVFEEIVLVLDCCRTTSINSRIVQPPLPITEGSPRRTQVRTFFAYAVPDGEAAREQPFNGTWRGIFTHALVEAMDKAIPNQAGRVRGREIADYVHQVVGTIQTPDFDVNHRRDIVFAIRRHADAVDVPMRLHRFAGGETVEITDHTREEVLSLSPAADHFQLPLTAGFYKAVVQGTRRQTLFEVPSDIEVVL